MTPMKDITSVTEHQNHLDDHFRHVKATGRPMFVTAEGETVAVVLSPTTYDKLAEEAERARSSDMVERSFEDIQAGRTQPAKEAIEEIAAELGLTLERRPAHR